VIAGAAKMEYRRFFMFNVIGGVAWVISMLLIGYAITPLLDPPLKRLFGAEFEAARHVEKLIILVVFISIAPGLYAGAKAWLAKRRKKGLVTEPADLLV
jgi:membrane-associated protein